MRRLWVTGYRSYEINAFQEDDPKVKVVKRVLKQRMKALLDESEDEFWLITGPQLGVEQWAAQTAVGLKSDYRQLKVAIMLPFADFASKWNADNQRRLAVLRQQVDFSRELTDRPYQSPDQLRLFQQFMLDHTDRALFVYDPDHPGKPKYDYRQAQKYSDQHDYPVDVVDFDDLQEAAIEWGEEEQEKKMADRDF